MEAKGSISSSVAGIEAACPRTRTLGIFVARVRGVPMTANKDFKRIVRDTARRTGQSYAAVQQRLRADGALPSTERRLMNIVRTIPDVRSLNMPASRAFYEGVLGFEVAMEHAGMMILASATQPKQQVTLNADAADALPLPPGFAVDVGFPESVKEIHEQAIAQGYTIIEPMEDKPIGIRRFSLLDPNGTRVTIVAHLNPAHQPAR
jgi:catechol 2,3-dioxygenase-like lactoylglutathione lyase family enzyme